MLENKPDPETEYKIQNSLNIYFYLLDKFQGGKVVKILQELLPTK